MVYRRRHAQSKSPTRSSSTSGAQGPPAGRMVLRRLCRRRHHPADRRRGAVRGARPPRGPEGARRRRRQRQRLARRRAALVQRGRHRLRARAPRTRAASAPRPSGSTSSSARPMRKRCRFPTRSFDVVVSTFGVMFTPDQDRAAAELVRVCRRGGKIGLANWTPDGFIGQLFKTIGKHVPPPPGARSPALWGTRARLAELFEPHALDRGGATALRVPLPLARALAGGLQDLLRPAAQDVRRARRRRRKRRSSAISSA